jgi:hypothetical protein
MTKYVIGVLFFLITFPERLTKYRCHFNVHWSGSNHVPCPRLKGPQIVYVKALRAEEDPATKPSNTGSF